MALSLDELKQAYPILCSERGRLDAMKIAEAFGMDPPEIAQSLKTSEEVIAAEPDASSVQEGLSGFARVYQLTRLKQVTPVFFKTWLRSPIESLKGERPIALLVGGESDILAELVENLITGQPV